jgi:hypothetical protein
MVEPIVEVNAVRLTADAKAIFKSTSICQRMPDVFGSVTGQVIAYTPPRDPWSRAPYDLWKVAAVSNPLPV